MPTTATTSRPPSAEARPGPDHAVVDGAGRDGDDLATSARLAAARTASPEERTRLHREVVEAHLWLAERWARHYHGRGLEDDDLLQVARCGLLEACLRFDPARGSYDAFATVTVIGLLKRQFRDRAWAVRPPRRTQELVAETTRRWPLLAQQCLGAPTREQIAAAVGAGPADVDEVEQANRWYQLTSLEALALEVGAGTGHGAEPFDAAELVETRLVVRRAVSGLGHRDRSIVDLYFYQGRSQRDVAHALGISQMHVSRLLRRVLTELRAAIGDLDGTGGGRPEPGPCTSDRQVHR